MSPLDQNSLQSKITRIRKNLKELKKLAALSYDDYSKNDLNKAIAERFLHVNIEAMLDIGSHIIAEEALGEPLEYRDIFLLLTKHKILPSSYEKQYFNT